MLQMSELAIIEIEEWRVVVNKEEYILTNLQGKVLAEEIKKGNRGIIMFKDFAISIPYIQEFYKIINKRVR